MADDLDVSAVKDTQQIKIGLLELINQGRNPFEIISFVAKGLEEVSAEPGYAKYLTDQIRAVYGYALGEKKPLQDEYDEIKLRLATMESRQNNDEFSAEVRERIGFAIEAHKKQLENLSTMTEQ